MRRLSMMIFALGLASQALAGLRLLATTADLGALSRELLGSQGTVEVICPPNRDPHELEPKPSYMLKASKADLVLATGLELEVGWLPSILRGGRNPKVLEGTAGYFDAGKVIVPLEVAHGATRAEGDVHPDGNPHYMLDPIRQSEVAVALAARLGELDPDHAKDYADRALALKGRLERKAGLWKQRLIAAGLTQVYTYHRTLTYLLDRFEIKASGELEPKPGIPPTASHLVELIRKAKELGVTLTLVESFYDRAGADKVAAAVPGMRVALVDVQPQAADAKPEDAAEAIIKAMEAK